MTLGQSSFKDFRNTLPHSCHFTLIFLKNKAEVKINNLPLLQTNLLHQAPTPKSNTKRTHSTGDFTTIYRDFLQFEFTDLKLWGC